jgi:hypothetical protein
MSAAWSGLRPVGRQGRIGGSFRRRYAEATR